METTTAFAENDEMSDDGQRECEPVAGTVPDRGAGSWRFWPRALRNRKTEMIWHEPVISTESIEPLVQRLDDLLQKRLPFHAWHWAWKARTKLTAASNELDIGSKHVQDQVDRLERTLEEIESRKDQRMERLAAALGTAGLVIPGANDPEEDCKTWQSVSQQAVEQALFAAAPTSVEVAGEMGVEPPPGGEGLLNRVGAALLELLGPVFAGSVVAVALATLTGLLTLADLQKGSQLPIWAAVLGIGWCVVKFTGRTLARAVMCLARVLEPKPTSGQARRFHRSAVVAIAFIAVAAALICSEITTEAYGIRALHEQRIVQAKRMGELSVDAKLLPTSVYFLIGLLISGPYLACTGLGAWNRCERELREAAIEHAQRQWLDRAKERPEVQESLELACLVSCDAADAARIVSQIQAHKDRQEALRLQAVGVAEQSHHELDEMIRRLEPLERADHFQEAPFEKPRRGLLARIGIHV